MTNPNNAEELYDLMNRLYIRIGRELHDNYVHVNTFNKDVQNLIDSINDAYFQTDDEHLKLKYRLLLSQFNDLFRKYEIEFIRFSILEDLVSDISSGNLT